MLTYRLTAASLKAFSLNAATKAVYRQLGNWVGGKKRSGAIKPSYIPRADANLAYIERHGAIADGMRVLELGTGWVHWEALFTRLFYEVEIVLFDVWDNRQFAAFQTYLAALEKSLDKFAGSRGAKRVAHAKALAANARRCTSFEEVYDALSMTYLLDNDGKLDAITDGSIDLVISSDVMEHIPASTLPRLAASLARIVKPGGHVAQQIVEADHLCIYAKSAHPKAYLQFDDKAWARWFENDVQYMNRWQHSDFVRLFRSHGFAIVADEIVQRADTSTLPIAARWKDYDRDDLDAAVTRLLVANNKEAQPSV